MFAPNPALEEAARNFVNLLLGTNLDEVRYPKSPNHELGYQEGHVDGLIEGIDRTLAVIEEFPDLRLSDLYDVLGDIREELADDEEDDEAEETVGTDPTLDFLRAIFGPNVQVVRLEPTPR